MCLMPSGCALRYLRRWEMGVRLPVWWLQLVVVSANSQAYTTASRAGISAAQLACCPPAAGTIGCVVSCTRGLAWTSAGHTHGLELSGVECAGRRTSPLLLVVWWCVLL
jgi:hypothetical protein